MYSPQHIDIDPLQHCFTSRFDAPMHVSVLSCTRSACPRNNSTEQFNQTKLHRGVAACHSIGTLG